MVVFLNLVIKSNIRYLKLFKLCYLAVFISLSDSIFQIPTIYLTLFNSVLFYSLGFGSYFTIILSKIEKISFTAFRVQKGENLPSFGKPRLISVYEFRIGRDVST